MAWINFRALTGAAPLKLGHARLPLSAVTHISAPSQARPR